MGRRIRIRQGAAAVALLCLGVVPASAQQLRGRVVDSTGAAVAGAQILVYPESLHVTANDSGRFALGPLKDGVHLFRVRRLGYSQVVEQLRTPIPGDSIVLTMAATAVELETVKTFALEQQLPRVFEREREHVGAALYGAKLQDVLNRVSGETVEESLSWDRAVAMKLLSSKKCIHMTFVDGVLTRAPLQFYLDKDQIAAIEVFNSADYVDEPIPQLQDFQADSAGRCVALILVWSKHYHEKPLGGGR